MNCRGQTGMTYCRKDSTFQQLAGAAIWGFRTIMIAPGNVKALRRRERRITYCNHMFISWITERSLFLGADMPVMGKHREALTSFLRSL